MGLSTFTCMEMSIIVGIWYLLMTSVLSLAVHRIETRLKASVRDSNTEYIEKEKPKTTKKKKDESQTAGVLRGENIENWYGQLEVLRDILLTVHRGEVVVIIRASGPVKSTLLRCANFPKEAQKGEVYLEGGRIEHHEKQLSKPRRELGMVFQHLNFVFLHDRTAECA